MDKDKKIDSEVSSSPSSVQLGREEIISVLGAESEEGVNELIQLFKKIGGRKGFLRFKKIIDAHSEEKIGKNIDQYVNDIISGNFKENIAKEYIQDLVLDKINNEKLLPITQGQEGEIFKVRLSASEGDKDYIVAKRKFYGGSSGESEFMYQKKGAYLLSQSVVKDNVYVPTPIHYFSDNDSDYLVMEEVDGKTLYCILLESMFSDLLVYCEKKGFHGFVDEMNNKYGNHIKNESTQQYQKGNLATFWQRHYAKKHMPFFNHDGEAARGLGGIIEFLGVFTDYFKNEKYGNLNPSNIRNQDQILKILYEEYSKGHGLFSKNEVDYLSTNMRIALKSLHAGDVYHRDIGQNLRNIMFGYDSKIAVIDFGKAHNEEDYTNIDESGRYDKDEEILSKFKAFEQPEISESEKYYEELIKAEKLKDTLIFESFVDDLKNYLGFHISEDMIPSPRVSTVRLLKSNYEYNTRKGGGDREHYFFLQENGAYLSKKEEIMANEYGDKSSLQISYLIGGLINLDSKGFLLFKKYIETELESLKRKSVRKHYTLFFRDIIDIIEKNLSK